MWDLICVIWVGWCYELFVMYRFRYCLILRELHPLNTTELSFRRDQQLNASIQINMWYLVSFTIYFLIVDPSCMT
jgi:hypothetical protein